MNYKEIIESRYNREAWQGLLHDIFHNNVKFWSNPIPIQVSNRLAKTALRLGNITLSDGETIAVYEVELNDKVDISRNKRGIRDMLTSDWRGMGYIGAFVFSYRKNESSLRFSYVSETWDFDKDGNYEKRSTDTMRYTYLLGEGRGCRTAIDRFTALKESKQTLSDITAAFSVETLTKLFTKISLTGIFGLSVLMEIYHFPTIQQLKKMIVKTLRKNHQDDYPHNLRLVHQTEKPCTR